MATGDRDSVNFMRCPICLGRHQTIPGLAPDAEVRCNYCDRTSRWSSWLPAHDLPTDSSSSVPKVGDGPLWRSRKIQGLCILLFLMAWGYTSYLYMASLNGPQFLRYYAVVFGLTWFGSLVARDVWGEEWIYSIIPCIFYEGVGVIRLITGMMSGMHRFTLMLVMMAIGGCIFFLRVKSGGGGYGLGGSCAIGGCGGGGGGGGCGGGGCGGGCGGCGG